MVYNSSMKFYKLHGAGNDYIYFDCLKKEIENPQSLAIRLSDRHFGIGGDGIILICKSDVADCKMRMFNADGSEGKMCGNAVRCVGKLMRDLGYIESDSCTVETLSGVKTLKLYFGSDGKVVSATADLGAAVLDGEKIPSAFKGERVVNAPLSVDGKEYKVTLVSMGNPHCVLFEDPDTVNLEDIGGKIENHPAFPDRINCEFVKVTDKNNIKMRVWERGSGETLACGTGACASAVACCLNGFCKKGEEVNVLLRGGTLKVVYTDERVTMTGPCELSFTGEVEI